MNNNDINIINIILEIFINNNKYNSDLIKYGDFYIGKNFINLIELNNKNDDKFNNDIIKFNDNIDKMFKKNQYKIQIFLDNFINYSDSNKGIIRDYFKLKLNKSTCEYENLNIFFLYKNIFDVKKINNNDNFINEFDNLNDLINVDLYYYFYQIFNYISDNKNIKILNKSINNINIVKIKNIFKYFFNILIFYINFSTYSFFEKNNNTIILDNDFKNYYYFNKLLENQDYINFINCKTNIDKNNTNTLLEMYYLFINVKQ